MREDRFTELPEELARFIFSALPTPDFFALHRSSKKCRQLCLTTSFDLLPYFVGRDRSEGCENELANYLDRFLAHRGRRKTQYFRLGYAMQNEDEELDLDFTLDDAKRCINFPHSLYTCESLRCLTMNLNRNHFYWDFPSSIPFPNLQFLSLKLLKVNNGCLFGEWNPSWNTIKEIRFEQVDIIGGMKIKSSCLVRFEVLGSYIDKLSILGERLEVEVQWPKTLGNLSISGERELRV